MGYYLSLGWQQGRTPLVYEELLSFIKSQTWSQFVDDPDYKYPILLFSYNEPGSLVHRGGGVMDIEKKEPRSGSLLAPWISIRLSWGSMEKEILAKILFLLELGQELNMVLLDENNALITWDNLELVMKQFFNSSDTILGLLGSIRQGNN